jgi:hypothetical protein
MSNIGLSTWLLMGMVVTGVYVLPSVTARFHGSHTMEFNASGTGQTNASALACGECHNYISEELNATGTSGTHRVLSQHILALETGAYANTSADNQFLNITTGVNIDKTKVCPLCHTTETKISGSHTQVITRLCQDPDCHGYNSTKFGDYIIFEGQNVTEKLNSSYDAHSGWYSAAEGVDSDRAKANTSNTEIGEWGTDYGQGYMTCLGCHSTIGVVMELQRPQTVNFTISIDSSGTVTVSEVGINQTDLNTTRSTKAGGVSVWN